MLGQMFADLRCSPSCTRAGIHGTVAICPPDCFQYKGTLDVFYKIIRQVSAFVTLVLLVGNIVILLNAKMHYDSGLFFFDA